MLIPWRVYFDRKNWMLELDTSILVCWVSFFLDVRSDCVSKFLKFPS